MYKKIICAVSVLVLMCALQAEAAFTDKPLNLGIMQFISRTKDVSPDQAAAVGDVLARMLTSSKTLTIIERERLNLIASEQQLSTTGLTDDTALTVGKIAGCQYMLLGTVTSYQQSVSTTDLWLWGKTDYYASTAIDIRIVDVNTTKVILSLSETGETRKSGTKFNFYGMNSQSNMDFRGLAAGAITDAASRLSYKILHALTGECSHVLKTSKKDITLSTGAVNGAHIGGLYRVYIEGEKVKDMNDNVLGRRENNIAVVKITGVQSDFSTAKIAHEKAGHITNIQRGDKIFPVSSAELKTMIDNKEFPAKRPQQIKFLEVY